MVDLAKITGKTIFIRIVEFTGYLIANYITMRREPYIWSTRMRQGLYRTAWGLAISAGLSACGATPPEMHFFAQGRALELVLPHADTASDQAIISFGERGPEATITRTIVVGFDHAQALASALDARFLESWRLSTFDESVALLQFATWQHALNAANSIYGQPGIRFAHPDFKLAIEARGKAVDEPLFEAAWHLENRGQSGGTPGADIGARAAWDLTQGDANTLVAVIDLGFEQNHPDLKDNWYVNTGEIIGNKVDDDGNGLVDDHSGWNFTINSNNLIYGMNANHGTAVAGVIAAKADGLGSSGICPACRILPLVIDEVPSNAAAAINYAVKSGAAVISNSWGYRIGTPTTDVVIEAINKAVQQGRQGRGTSVVFAMDNVGHDNCKPSSPDISSLEMVIAVSSSDHNDQKISETGYGPCLDIVAPSAGAPHDAIVTTDRPGEKGYNAGTSRDDFNDLSYTKVFYGTSAAAPQVSATLALMYSLKNDLEQPAARQLLLSNAEKIDSENGNYDPQSGVSNSYGHGRLAAGKTLEALRHSP